MASSTHTFRSRDEYRKAKELEEARKAGTVAPEVDEEGNDINPHIPQYIAKAPWYLNQHHASLKHQKSQKEKDRERFDKFGSWYARGETEGKAASSYRKGACANCGAMTHKAKDCVERPRQRGAKFTNKNVQADEVVRHVNLDYEGKRDRWNGYDTREYKKVIERNDRLEEERKKIKAAEVEEKLAAGKDDVNSSDEENNDEEAEFRLKGEGEVILQQKDEGTPATVRNLRIRENTAKYLLNLDTNSAYYDPKSRSMREDPLPHIDARDKDYAGDNFVRYGGDVTKLGELELHAIKAAEENRHVPHLQSEPSLTEVLYRTFKEKKENQEGKKQTDIVNKYGGEEFKKVDESVMLEQSEVYVEYSRDGRVLKGPKPALPRSRYPEDVLENNHTAIWGSYFDRRERKWGYACCLQTVRNTYCTGEEGKAAKLASAAEMEKRSKQLREEKKAVAASEKATKEESAADDAVTTEEKVLQSMKKQQKEEAKFEPDDRKRGYNSMKGDSREVTEEEMEAYRRRRIRSDDPMANFLNGKS